MTRPGKLPYGYKTDGDRSVWIIDEETAEIVREMFRLYTSGTGKNEICRMFSRRGIPTPREYRRKKTSSSTIWSISSISNMLKDPVYIGRYVAYKDTTVSYKNHKHVTRPESEWVIIDSHHPAIIDVETFEAAERLRDTRRRYTSTGCRSILSGLVYCKDCGSTLTLFIQADKSATQSFICKTYRRASCFQMHTCTRHTIKAKHLEEIVFAKIKETTDFARRDEKKFAAAVYKNANKDVEKTIKAKTAELAKAERRIADLDTIISKTTEDRVLLGMSDERFKTLLAKYEAEQTKLNETATTLKTEISDLQTKTANIQGFMNLVNRYADITELTEELARMFVEKVVVHEAIYVPGKKYKKASQQVDVHLAYIGNFGIE